MILVTGAGGFIGSRLVDRLSDIEPDGYMFDPRLGTPHTINQVLGWHRHEITAVFHMGAISDTTCTDFDALHETNVLLSIRLARFCHGRAIPFIYASSASVYGNGDGPINDYARSKQRFDWIIDKMPNISTFQWYGCRFFNVYGPGEAHKGRQASLVHQILNGKRDLFALDASRDFIHVDDAVDVMLWMWRTRPPSGIYDVGSGESVTIAKLATIIGVAPAEVPMPKSLVGKYQTNTCADLSKLRAAGYDAEFMSLDEGVRRMK